MLRLESGREGLAEAAARHKFGVLDVHDLKAKMAEKGVALDHECRILRFIITPGQEGPRRKPTAMIALYANPELEGVAADVETTLDRIMAEAAG
jgi:hypothetical protein